MFKKWFDISGELRQQKERNYYRFNCFVRENEHTMYKFMNASKQIADIQKSVDCKTLKEFCDRVNKDPDVRLIKFNLVIDSESSIEHNKCFLVPEIKK